MINLILLVVLGLVTFVFLESLVLELLEIAETKKGEREQ